MKKYTVVLMRPQSQAEELEARCPADFMYAAQVKAVDSVKAVVAARAELAAADTEDGLSVPYEGYSVLCIMAGHPKIIGFGFQAGYQ